MKLVILYGPPAAGKLTIAQKLSDISDIHVFDNHQVIDMIEPIVTRKYSGFAELIYQTQQNILEAAVKSNHTNVVTTFPYASSLKRDVEFMEKITTICRQFGADVYPVFLKCSNDTLMKRALEPSRKAYGKIITTEVMEEMIKNYEFDEPAPVKGGITIDTDHASAKESALHIKKLIEL